MALQYLPILFLIILGILLAGLFTLLAVFFGPKKYSEVKAMPFESGMIARGSSHKRYDVKFYLVAMVFLIFDVEIILLYPWAMKFRTLGWFGFMEAAVFFAFLILALVYVWKKGALEWD